MLYSIVALSDIFANGNMPTLDGIYINNCEFNRESDKGAGEMPQQIMSTNPRDFLSGKLSVNREE